MKPYFTKHPCGHWRLLDVSDCPPIGIEHDIDDYPVYYTPLWTPQYFPEVFCDEKMLCCWVESEFKALGYGCTTEIGIQEIVVYFANGAFKPLSLSFSRIASVDFYPPTVLKKVDQPSVTSWQDSLKRFPNSSWLFSTQEHIEDSLICLSLDELRSAATRFYPSIVRGKTKSEYASIIAMKVTKLNRDLANATMETLRVMCLMYCKPLEAASVPSELMASRRGMLSFVMGCNVGIEVARRVQVPPSAIYFPEALCEPSSKMILEETLGTASEKAQISSLRKMAGKILGHCLRRVHPSRIQSVGVVESKYDSASLLVRSLRDRSCELGQMDNTGVRDVLHCWEPLAVFPAGMDKTDTIKRILSYEYGPQVMQSIWSTCDPRLVHRTAMERDAIRLRDDGERQRQREECDRTWPQIVPRETIHACLNDYMEGMKWSEPPVCAVCARSSSSLIYNQVHSGSELCSQLRLDVLYVVNPALANVMRDSGDTDHWDIEELDHIMLSPRGIRRSGSRGFVLDVCNECKGPLLKGKIPRLALANGLYRGSLPQEFRDLTWVEEMVCCKHLSTAIVTRLTLGHGVYKSRKLRGNTCAHEMNVLSTAKSLPRAPVDVNGMLSVVFIGPQKPDDAKLKQVFYVRRKKVWDFLMWLKDNNELYADIAVDPDIMNLYPEDGVLPGLSERIIFNENVNAEDVYEEETSGIPEHASTLISESQSDELEAFIEKTGVSDADIHYTPARFAVASSLRNLVPRGKDSPVGMEIYRGTSPLPEYKNPTLLPGMYPTLFPYGIGGFEDPGRPVPIGFSAQAKYYLDLEDRVFRYHHSFIFVVLNIIQRRTGHLYTSFTVSRAKFDDVANALNGVSPDTIRKLAEVIEKEGNQKNLSDEEKNVLLMLKYVNTIATKVPGSAASKTLCRNEIRSYVGVMGVPQIFLTINPSPQHHPVFLLMVGEKEINLNERYPELLPGPERAKRLAKDPVAAADFFDRSIRLIFEHLFGWDFDEGKSSERGGILGKLTGFYGTAEYTERGVLHGHFLLWMRGGLNPTVLHQKMKDSDEFRARFFAFFEDIIKHDLPDVDLPPGFQAGTYKPATEMPPPPLPNLVDGQRRTNDEVEEWEDMFASEVKACGEALQRHSCKKVCHKYGNEGKCRFRFPHELVEDSYFDPKDNAVIFRCRDGTVNYYNPHMLVYCRHNHDIRCILSGRSAKAAMFYITDYITKMSLKTSQMLSLMCEAVMATPTKENATAVESAKSLLHKCLSQFSKKQQIHAQQAARYLRGHLDSISSHTTVPLLSNLAYTFLKERYQGRLTGGVEEFGDPVDDEEASDGSSESDSTTVDFEAAELLEVQRNPEGISHDNEDVDRANHDHSLVAEDDSHCNMHRSSDEADGEYTKLKMSTNDEGKVVKSTQLDDYLFRSDELRRVCFLDFVCWFKLERKYSGARSERINVRKRYSLKEGHCLATTHEIVERFLEDMSDVHKIQLIPRVVGMSIPRRRQKDIYALFLFGHFVPFSKDYDPLGETESVNQFIEKYRFSDEHRTLIENWDVIYECEDARDADRLAQQERYMEESRRLQEGLHNIRGDDTETGVDLTEDSTSKRAERDLLTLGVIRKLQYAKYLSVTKESETVPGIEDPRVSSEEGPMEIRMRIWDKEIQTQQANIASARENILHHDDQDMVSTDDFGPLGTEIREMRGAQISFVGNASECDDMDCDDECPDSSSDDETSPSYVPVKVKKTKVNDSDKLERLKAETPEAIMNRIKSKHNLNDRQSAAFLIAARAWLSVYGRRQAGDTVSEIEDSSEPLRMLMTGPGGTGKSHSIQALKEFMEVFGSGHRLRLLAPTGSAASLIEGMTCHKGLGLKVKKRAEKKDIMRTSINEQFEMEMSVQKKNEMRLAWKNVDVVLIDEVSLLSLQWLTEIDHALRMAKEKPNEWFGGVIVIFSGDFCQYPPVGGHALFTSVRSNKTMTSSELKRRLGRLAWKTLNTVVEFKEQFRMKGDPEYAEAVSRLRLRQCTEQDVALFNSRVIRSSHHKEGIDMSSAEHRSATMIVATNDLRERVNQYKVECECASDPSSKKLVVCNAFDTIDGHLVPMTEYSDLRRHVLNLRTAAHSAEGALPGRIHLFEGMPVILRGRNLAVDLRIANGSQGVVHKIETAIDQYGLTYARLVLVYFPDSPVKLSDLPQGVFPVQPVHWTFNTTLELKPGERTRRRVRRSQLPIQPGFCITGHSAQGKTLGKVLCDLSTGSWAAYVAVSRARRREDLYLLKHVTLAQLNKKLPHDLVCELKRYAAMENNTMINHGFRVGQIMDVPDAEDHHFRPESSRYVNSSPDAPRDSDMGSSIGYSSRGVKDAEHDFYDNDAKEEVKSTSKSVYEVSYEDVKSKSSHSDALVTDTGSSIRKRKLVSQIHDPRTTKTRRVDAIEFQAATWDPLNWSCAYDSLFVILWSAFSMSAPDWRMSWERYNTLTSDLSTSFHTIGDPLTSSQGSSADSINFHRDAMRNRLSELSYTSFPRYGEVCISIQELIHTVLRSDCWSLALAPRSGREQYEVSHHHTRRHNLWTDLYERGGDELLSYGERHTHQCWINASCTLLHEWVWAPCHGSECGDAGETPLVIRNPPIILALNHTPAMNDTVLPLSELCVPTSSGMQKYQLAGIVYYGMVHFTARIILGERIFEYDGQREDGRCIQETRYDLKRMSVEDWASLTSLKGRSGHVYMYRKISA